MGSGAFGYLNGSVYANLFDIPEYIKRVEQGKFPIAARRDYDCQSTMLYDIFNSVFWIIDRLESSVEEIRLLRRVVSIAGYCIFSAYWRHQKRRQKGHLCDKEPILWRHYDAGIFHFRKQLPRLLPFQFGRKLLMRCAPTKKTGESFPGCLFLTYPSRNSIQPSSFQLSSCVFLDS